MTAHPAPRTTDNDAQNRRDAMQMLEVMSDYGASRELMLDELTFNFGYTARQAESVYNEWCKQVA